MNALLKLVLGGILNIILDPIFISVFGMEIAGAAIATLLSNIIATAYFILLIIKNRDHIVLSFNPGNYTLKHGIDHMSLFDFS